MANPPSRTSSGAIASASGGLATTRGLQASWRHRLHGPTRWIHDGKPSPRHESCTLARVLRLCTVARARPRPRRQRLLPRALAHRPLAGEVRNQKTKTMANGDTPRVAASLSIMSSDDTRHRIKSHSSIGSVGSDVAGARVAIGTALGASGAARTVAGRLLTVGPPPASAADELAASPVPPSLPATVRASPGMSILGPIFGHPTAPAQSGFVLVALISVLALTMSCEMVRSAVAVLDDIEATRKTTPRKCLGNPEPMRPM